MQVIRDAAGLAPLAGGVFVPTMGALHTGHMALIHHARLEAAKRSALSGASVPVVVSVFVNPTQFNDHADFERYPVTIDADLRACDEAGADAVFTPARDVIYPPGVDVPTPSLPAVAGGVPELAPRLEDAHRPGHFAGVCQVVKRLFDLVRPAAAVFGEKDWQQYRTIQAMVEQERIGVEIIPSPTVRDPDGLAMSSRNRFLTLADRERALSLSRGLRLAREIAEAAEAELALQRVMEEAGVEVEYAAVRDAATLLPLEQGSAAPEGCRALVAARVGSVRLIDNMPWGGEPAPL